MEKGFGQEEKGIPVACSKCGGKLVYRGIGEYLCPKCMTIEYDQYGKVRNYLEQHPGASVPQVCRALGLSRAEISRMIEEGKFHISDH